MKKRLTFITFLMLFCSTVFGQSHWEMTQQEMDFYQNSQTICISVQIDGVDQKVKNLEIAAFHNNTLRGVGTTVYFEPKDIYYASVKVYGTTPGETINFKLYDTTSDEPKELSSDYSFDWNPANGSIGTPFSPIPVNFYENHWENNVGNYHYYMSIVSTIKIDGTIQNRTDLELAAFSGEELRGATRMEKLEGVDVYIAALLIGGEGDESISFKLYDPITKMELDTDFTTPFVADAMIGGVEPFSMEFFTPVAKVGETYYTTLAAAVDAATVENNTVTLLRDVEGSGVVIDKDVTIDFSGFIYTFNEGVGSTGTPSNGFQILKDNEVTLKNGTLQVSSEENVAKTFYTIIQNYANLTVEDMTLDGTYLDKWSSTDGDSYVVSINSGSVNITGNTTIIANDYSSVTPSKAFAFDACDQTSKGYALPVVTVNTTGAVTGAVEVSATLNIEALGEGSEISYISIDGKGQLFHKGLTTTIKKHITGTEAEGWYTISSPVGDVAHTDVVGLLNDNYDLYYYNEKDMMWENVKDTEDNTYTELKNGQGYLYANTLDTDLLFKGPLNTAAVTYSISYTGGNSLAGFNLIGNPFTYNITKSNMSGASLAEGFYTLSNQGAWQTNAESATIAPMQGALIKATEETTANFTIAPNSAKRSESENNGQIKIEVSNDNYNDVAYVSFNEGIGLDKIEHRNAEIPMVYVPVEGVNYAIAMMNQEVTEIPVSFEAKSMGQYTIGVEAQDCEYAMMTLVDRFTGIETNLLIEDYTFIAKSNDSAERFIIKLAMDNSNGEANENFAFINNGMMYIYNIEGQGTVSVYDVTGRPVAEYNVATSANISTSDFAAGMYIIRMSDENGVKTQKIVVE